MKTNTTRRLINAVQTILEAYHYPQQKTDAEFAEFAAYDEWKAKVGDNWWKKLDSAPEIVQMSAVKSNGNAIKYIKNPSEKVQLVAVRAYGMALKHIKNPSEKVQRAALTSDFADPDVFKNIQNPSEEMQLKAVRSDGTQIRKIKNPSEKVQLAAINDALHAIYYIKNPSPNVLKKAKEMFAAEKEAFLNMSPEDFMLHSRGRGFDMIAMDYYSEPGYYKHPGIPGSIVTVDEFNKKARDSRKAIRAAKR